MVENLLSKLVLAGTSAKKGAEIDLNLALKALPLIIDSKNLDKVKLFNF